MAINLSSGFNFDTGSGDNHVHLIASIGGTACIHEIRVQGTGSLSVAQVSLATGGFGAYNLVAGLQYGAVGHVPGGITNGSGSGESWLAFAAAVPTTAGTLITPGATPQTIMESAFFAIDIKWAGLFAVPSAGYDLHFELGCQNTDPTPTFKLFYAYSVTYTT